MIKKSLKFGKNPDEIVKDSLRWISKFYPSMSPIINTIYPKEDKKIFTMAVTPSGSKGTLLLYNPEFVILSTEYFHDNLPDVNTKDYGKTIICNVSKHEIYHIMHRLDAQFLRHFLVAFGWSTCCQWFVKWPKV